MATLNNAYPTLADVAKTLDPDGKTGTIVEILSQTNEILQSMPWYQGNLPTGHRHNVRTGIPLPTWRRLNYGVLPAKATTAQVTDNCGMLEAYAEVDAKLVELHGDPAGYRFTQEKAFIEGMSQEVARTIFYGNEGSDPAKFTGLAPRYNTRNAATAASADNVIHGGSSTADENASIWLIGWGEDKVGGLYPKNTKGGLSQEDKGKVTLESAPGGPAGGRMEAYRTHYGWDCGLMVPDWRYVARIANIRVGTLTKDAASGSDLPDLMVDALERLPSLTNCKPVFYVNRTIRSYLRRQIKNAKNVYLTLEQVAGKQVMMFDGVPVERCDVLTNTEAVVPS